MNSIQSAIHKLGKKNIIIVVIFFIFFGILYAIRKGSLSAAIFPTVLGLLLFLIAAIYLVMRTSRLTSKKKKEIDS
jgi:hypothetical protein